MLVGQVKTIYISRPEQRPEQQSERDILEKG